MILKNIINRQFLGLVSLIGVFIFLLMIVSIMVFGVFIFLLMLFSILVFGAIIIVRNDNHVEKRHKK